MTVDHYRALVVDDEQAIRALTVASLTEEGIHCDEAADGDIALHLCQTTRYDVVVTDLRMPRKHGHSLAVELLAQEVRPAIVIFTGLAEPRLAKDLMTRGVDDILFKPIDLCLLATKVKLILTRRRATTGVKSQGIVESRADRVVVPLTPLELTSVTPASQIPCAVTGADVIQARPIELPELDSKLANVARILSLSPIALDTFTMARLQGCGPEQFAHIVQRDPGLTAEVTQFARGVACDPSQRAASLLESIELLGQKRIGEIAVGLNVLHRFTSKVVPPLNVDLEWKRSVAAGIAMSLLIASGQHGEIEEGLTLGAIAHGLGRILLATLFPGHCARMLSDGDSLPSTFVRQELAVFPENHATILVRLLTKWKIPGTTCEPLARMLDDDESLQDGDETTLLQSELLRLAVLIGEIAAGGWNAWDQIHIPRPETLTWLRIRNLAEILATTQAAIGEFAKLRRNSSRLAPLSDGTKAKAPPRRYAYINLAAESCDLLAISLASQGIFLDPRPRNSPLSDEATVVNCLNASAGETRAWLAARSLRQAAVFARPSCAKPQRVGAWLELPASCQAIQSACQSVCAI